MNYRYSHTNWHGYSFLRARELDGGALTTQTSFRIHAFPFLSSARFSENEVAKNWPSVGIVGDFYEATNER